MSSGLRPAARRLHGLALGLLALQLLLAGAHQPLAWGGGLLVLLAGLKLRESRCPADLQRVALTAWVCIGLLAVLQPALAASLLQGVTALLVLAALLAQQGGNQHSLRRTLARSLQLSLAALPLLVVLFLLLPRLGPLWSLPGGGAGRTGLDGKLDPGAISRLVQDPSPALRISWLAGGPPAAEQRYWRVLVLDRFDGRRWSAAPLPSTARRRGSLSAGTAPDQIWQAEPSPLAALPWAGEGRPSDPALQISAQGVLVGAQAGDRRRPYGISSGGVRPADSGGMDWRATLPTPAELSLPAGRNPWLEAQGQSWRALPAEARVEAAAALFRRQQLRYTLTPPPLPEQAPLDALLLQTRSGFCEHFASAFSALMRAAGVPARVVVGYQGGEWIEAGRWGLGFLEVRQSDAHAWSEVWLNGRGWVRVDPTAWVAPARIQEGSDVSRRLLGLRFGWWSALERGWTRLDLAWSRWVLGYDADGQVRLLGLWQRWQGELLLGALGLALVPAVWLLQWQRPPASADRWRRQLERSLAGLRRLGLQPQAGEDLERFCRRAAAALPPARAALQELAGSYGGLRFGQQAGSALARRRWQRARRQLAQALRRQRQPPVERAG